MTSSKQLVQIGDMPDYLLEDIVQRLASYSVGFIRIDETPRGKEPVFLGSGTFVKAKGVRAIMTAHHVLKCLPRNGKLGIVFKSSMQLHFIDIDGLAFIEIARGKSDMEGPDLAAIILAPNIASSIEAKASFYSLDISASELSDISGDLSNGIWAVQGFLEEYSKIEHNPNDIYVRIKPFNFCGFGGPESIDDIREYDFCSFPVVYNHHHSLPKSFGGMSGGALWKIGLSKSSDGIISPSNIALSGVLFYQEALVDNQSAVRCHGPKSVYSIVYNTITNHTP